MAEYVCVFRGPDDVHPDVEAKVDFPLPTILGGNMIGDFANHKLCKFKSRSRTLLEFCEPL